MEGATGAKYAFTFPPLFYREIYVTKWEIKLRVWNGMLKGPNNSMSSRFGYKMRVRHCDYSMCNAMSPY